MGLFEELQANTKLGLVKGSSDFWDVETVPCGIPSVDYLLGGGAAFGRVLEMFGNEASGKTLLLYLFFIENIKRGGTSVLFESEGAFNPDFYRMLGGDPDKLLVYPVKSVEKVFDKVREFCKLKKKSKNSSDKLIVGWDSLAATGTEHLLETGMETVDMSKPRMMSQGFTLVSTDLKDTDVCFIIINQLRAKIDKHNPGVITPGGFATGFAASQRLSLFYSDAQDYKIYDIPEDADEDDKKKKKDFQQIGRKVKCEAIKNKMAGAWLKCNLYFYSHADAPHPVFDKVTSVGIDFEESLLDFYLDSYFFLPNGNRVVQRGSPGWYQLDASLDPDQEKFRKKDWPKVMEKHEDLRTLVYDLALLEETEQQTNPENPPPPPPNS